MQNFRRILVCSLVVTYLVILAGAIVRGTGSGLGCPDWPRCFGQWIPPLDISELPENYKSIYKIAGKTIADFDPLKTWTEYLNRLLGVVLGFFIVILFLISLRLKNYERNLPWFCGGLLLLILIQGGVGAVVVFTHLKPYIITAHMFLAVLLLFGLIYLKKYCSDLERTSLIDKKDEKGFRLTKMLVYLTFIQVLLGTQVRQQVDHFLRDTLQATPETVMSFLGPLFYIHRSFSLLIVGIFCALIFHFYKQQFNRDAFFKTIVAFGMALSNVATGIILNYFSFPPSAQPIHLFFGVFCLGTLYDLSLDLKGSLID